MADKSLLELPLAVTGAGALLYGVQDNVDKAFPASVLTGGENPQPANTVYAGPTAPPGNFPTFRPLVANDIPDLSGTYMAASGGNLANATLNNSTILGGTISGATGVFDEDKFTLRDTTDTTRNGKFNVALPAAATSVTWTLPAATATLVGRDTADTLTNKKIVLDASTTATAALRITPGQPPSAPINGDLWTTNSGLFAQINNATVGPFAAAASSTVNSWNGRVGAVTMSTSDVTTALGYTPYNPAAGSYVAKTGDTMTGLLRVNNVVKIQDAGGSMIRFISNGSGSTGIHSVNASETTFVPLNMTASDYNLTSSGSVNINASRLKVSGPAVPAGAFAGYIIQSLQANPGSNADFINTQYYRSNGSTGTSWSDFSWRWGRTVDATPMQYIDLQANGDIFFNCGTGTGGNVRFTATGAVVASGGFGPGSDPRLKETESLKELDNATEIVYDLNIKKGRYKSFYNDDGKERLFIMADKDMENSAPEVMLKGAIEHGDVLYDGWSADQMIALLAKAVQELTDEVRILKEKVNE